MPRVRYPVAIDGFDDRRDFVAHGGVPIRIPDGGTLRAFADTYYRPPADFDGGVPRDANRMLAIRFSNNGVSRHRPGRRGAGERVAALYLDGLPAPVRAARLRHRHRLRQQHPRGADLRLRRDDAPADQLRVQPLGDPADADALRERKPGQPSGRAAEHSGRGGDHPYSEPFDATVPGGVAIQYEGIVAGIVNEPLDAGLGAPREGIWPLSINSRSCSREGLRPGRRHRGAGGRNQHRVPVRVPDSPRRGWGPARPERGCSSFAPGRRRWPASRWREPRRGQRPGLHRREPCHHRRLPADALVQRAEQQPGRAVLHGRGRLFGVAGQGGRPLAAGRRQCVCGGREHTPQFVRFWRPSVDAGMSAAGLTQVGLCFELDYTVSTPVGLTLASTQCSPGATSRLPWLGLRHPLRERLHPCFGRSAHHLPRGGGAQPPRGAVALSATGVRYPGTTGADRVFVLYPAGNVIVDFSPTTVTYSAPTRLTTSACTTDRGSLPARARHGRLQSATSRPQGGHP